MSEFHCFFAEPVDRVKVELRRFVFSTTCNNQQNPCPGPYSYHNAHNIIGEKLKPLSDRYDRELPHMDHGDSRWPQSCECGYVFKEDDQWQVNEHRIYSGGGQEFILRDAPVGAMWDAWWCGDSLKGQDGIHLVVQTPGGEWMPDAPSRNPDGTRGLPWKREGVVPNVTVQPSIAMPNYHGYLTNGVLRSV